VTIVEVVFAVREGATRGGEFDLVDLGDDLSGAHVEKGAFRVISTPGRYILGQNYPNPFNPVTTIHYALPVTGERGLVSCAPHTTLKIYNTLGQEVVTLVDEAQEPGSYTVTWDASDMASGVYFCRLTAGGTSRENRGDFTATKPMLLLK